MSATRRHFLAAASLFPLASLLFSPLAQAQQGKTYAVITRPQPKDVAGKIEVIEFFHYGCPHCRNFNPFVRQWAAKAPADVSFRKVPTPWSPPLVNFARLYYTLEATGDLARLDEAAFALAQDARKYDTPSMEAWYVQQGGNVEKFKAAFNAFGVQNKVQAAQQLTQKMGIDSVPMLIVEGRYHVLGNSFEEQIANLDALIAELRKAGGKK